MSEVSTAPPVDPRATERARRWLADHHLGGIEPTPLLAARLRARDRGRRQALAVGGVLLVVLLVTLPDWGANPGLGHSNRRLLFFGAALNVVAILGLWWTLRGQRRVDRRLAGGVRRRVAHPVRPGWAAVAGPWHVASAFATYIAALAVAAVVAVVARTGLDRAVAVAAVVAVVGCAVLVAFSTADVVRRPALAEDPTSLAVDDVLRTADARSALSQVPAAAIVALPIIAGPGLNWWLFAGFVAVMLGTRSAAGLKEPTARPFADPVLAPRPAVP